MYIFGLLLTPAMMDALSNPMPCDGKKSNCNLSGICGQRCTDCAQLLCDCACPCESNTDKEAWT